MNKMILAICIACSALCAAAEADDTCKESSCRQCCGDRSGFCCEGCSAESGWSAYGQLLMWHGCQNGLEFASAGDNTGPGLFTAGVSYFMEFDWQPGFRVGASYQTCDRWNFGADLTYIDAEAQGHAARGSSAVLRAMLLNGAGGFNHAETAAGRLELNYWTLDLLASHPYCLCPTFEITPFLGFRALNFDQKMTIVYSGEDFDPEDGILYWAADLMAAGIHGGFGMRYHTCEPLFIFTKVAGSIVGAEVGGTHTQHAGGDLRVEINDTKHCTIIHGWEASLGATYLGCFCDRNWELSLAWEFINWTNTPNGCKGGSPPPPTASMGRGDTGFHGLTAGFKMDF